MPSRLKRYHTSGHDHFVTFSCYRRLPFLNNDHARTIFLDILEQTRQRHGFYLFGYVLMPEHVHLLLSEPKTPAAREYLPRPEDPDLTTPQRQTPATLANALLRLQRPHSAKVRRKA